MFKMLKYFMWGHTNKFYEEDEIKSTRKVPPKIINSVISAVSEAIPNFDYEKFLDASKLKFISFYRGVKDENYKFLENLCDESFLNELPIFKEQILNLHEDIDFISVHARKLTDFRPGKSYDEIDVRMNIFYVDHMKNNKTNYSSTGKRYVEAIFLVTFKAPSYLLESGKVNVCDKCGAKMVKREGRTMYVCEYCGNSNIANYEEWKISNVKKID